MRDLRGIMLFLSCGFLASSSTLRSKSVFELLDSNHPSVIVFTRTIDNMTVLIAANLSSAGASLSLDLSKWKGARAREVLWGCEYPPVGPNWFIYLPSYGFRWWLIGEVGTDDLAEEKIEKVNA